MTTIKRRGRTTRLLQRTKRLARSQKAMARSPIKKKRRSVAEKAAKFAREYGPPGFLEWIQAQPSVADGTGPCEAAHFGTGGTSYKADWTHCIPLTARQHRRELHQHGPSWFEAKYRISLDAALAETRARWLASVAATEG